MGEQPRGEGTQRQSLGGVTQRADESRARAPEHTAGSVRGCAILHCRVIGAGALMRTAARRGCPSVAPPSAAAACRRDCSALLPLASRLSVHLHVRLCVCDLTTIPMLVLSSADTISMVSSSTRFMNWSKPRSTPVTCRLPFSLTGERSRAHATPRGEEESTHTATTTVSTRTDTQTECTGVAIDRAVGCGRERCGRVVLAPCCRLTGELFIDVFGEIGSRCFLAHGERRDETKVNGGRWRRQGQTGALLCSLCFSFLCGPRLERGCRLGDTALGCGLE